MPDQIYRAYESELTSIADAIRQKGGTSADLTYPNGFVTAIQNIQTGTDTSDATLNSNSQMLSGYTAYSNGVKYTGSIPTKTSSDLTASTLTVTVPSGYYASNATKTLTDSNLVAGNIKKRHDHLRSNGHLLRRRRRRNRNTPQHNIIGFVQYIKYNRNGHRKNIVGI